MTYAHAHQEQGFMEQPKAAEGKATYADSIILKIHKASHENCTDHLSASSFQGPTKKRSYNGPAM